MVQAAVVLSAASRLGGVAWLLSGWRRRVWDSHGGGSAEESGRWKEDRGELQ